MVSERSNPEGFITSYIACGCNCFSQAMDWGENNNLVCFASCNSVAIYRPYSESGGKILCTCTGHKSKVNCVKWIRGRNIEEEFVSCSLDNNAVVWSLQSSEVIVPLSTLSGHTAPVHAVDGKYIGNRRENTIIVTAASDYTVRIWNRSGDVKDFNCLKVLNYSPSFVLCVNLIEIKENVLLLAVGTDTARVELYLIDNEVEHLTTCDGHEDWVRSIDMKESNGDILIASSAQDMSVRIYRLSQMKDGTIKDFFHNEHPIDIKGSTYFLSVETVLYGHEGWVLSVHWDPGSVLRLLTSSFDRTLVIWSPDPASDLWCEEARMGELGGDNTLGYFGARFGPQAEAVLSHSYQGSFHLWKKSGNFWKASLSVGGHIDGVMDVGWEKNGRYVISVSMDKTSRLHVPHFDKTFTWYEMSRPQIHGHALNSIAFLNNHNFASCAEEKVIRVFEPPSNVLKILEKFSDISFKEDLRGRSSNPSGASIPALGLSNKATYAKSEESEILDCTLTEPPNEDFLIQNTLWPEVMKLYGHGYEVFSVAASNDGTKLASACKSSSAEHAEVILWNTHTWDIIDKLPGHQLTVTQMSFSPDDTKLLSVSRDRKWCLYKKNQKNSYTLECSSDKNKNCHSRIIWTCAWTHDSIYFATGSRDCKLIVWKDKNPVSTLNSNCGPVTATGFANCYFESSSYLVAVGYDSGSISVYAWSPTSEPWSLLHSLTQLYGHCLTVQRIKFRPVLGRAGDKNTTESLQLVSCSLDHSVRIFDIIPKILKPIVQPS